MRGQHRALGERVAWGNTADVWQWTATTVVKVLRPGIPRQWAALEADITRRVHKAGLPAPATDGIVEIDGRPGIVLERIDGESMWRRMKSAPNELPLFVEALVDLQTGLHAAGPIEGLPDLGSRLRSKIDQVERLSPDERREALDVLAGLPTGWALCHGDIHPANVLMSARGMVVIDWFDAATGHPVADLARSSLLMRPPAELKAIRAYLEGATRVFLERMHGAYLSALVSRGLLGDVPFADWEAVLAVARMSEPLPTDDLVAIWEAWRSGAGEAQRQRGTAYRARS
jgi:aminoglycoside phosphotransferase (APT) family kinase protein